MLSVRRELLDTWTPYKLRPAPDEAPDRWETGTQNHEGLAGLIAAVDYLADVGRTYGRSDTGDDRRDAVVAGFGAIGVHERELAGAVPPRRGRHLRDSVSGASTTSTVSTSARRRSRSAWATRTR